MCFIQVNTALYGIDWDAPPNTDEDASRITIPQVSNPLRPEDYIRLQALIASHSSASSIDQYLLAVQFVRNVISDY